MLSLMHKVVSIHAFVYKNTQIYFYSDANLNLIFKFYVFKNGALI